MAIKSKRLDVNNSTFSGCLGADPELKYFNEKAKASFRIAVACGEGKEPVWLFCESWGQTGEFVNNYLKKGAWIVFTGRFSAWLDKDGKPRLTFTAEKIISHKAEQGDVEPTQDTGEMPF